jgi:hypothetical protein
MATASGALAPGKAPAGHGDKHIGRWPAALVAAALGLALLGGGLALQGRQGETTPAAAPAGVSTSMEYRWDDYAAAPGWPRAVARPYTGTCRAGSSECLPGEEIVPGVMPAAPISVPGPWLSTCRAGSSDCLPDEPIVPGVAPAESVPIPGPWPGTCRAGSVDCLPGDE